MSSALLKIAKILRRDFSELEKIQNSKQNIEKFVFKSIENIKESINIDLIKARPEAELCFVEEAINWALRLPPRHDMLPMKRTPPNCIDARACTCADLLPTPGSFRRFLLSDGREKLFGRRKRAARARGYVAENIFHFCKRPAAQRELQKAPLLV